MAAYVKIQSFVEKLAEKVHNLGADNLTVGLTTNLNAPVNTDNILTDITEIAYTFCSTRLLVVTGSIQVGGVYKLTVTDHVLTATGGSIGPFQWVFIYNDTAASKDLIAFFDYGSEITVLDGETFTLNFDDAEGLLQLT